MPPLHRARLVAQLIKSCRQDSGYESARAFFDCAGGKKILRCSYETYRRLEETSRLPNPVTFERIYEGLESTCDPQQLQSLARAYAHALLGEQMTAWPTPNEGVRRAHRPAFLPQKPHNICDEIWSDPRKLAAVVALESGRASVDDLPGPPAQARRALNRLVRAGVARRRGGVFVPVAGSFPITKTWAPTADERDDLINRIFSMSAKSDEIVGGATVFVHSDRGDMEEFFRHIRAAIAPHLREIRKDSKLGESVYLLELISRERIPAQDDA